MIYQITVYRLVRFLRIQQGWTFFFVPKSSSKDFDVIECCSGTSNTLTDQYFATYPRLVALVWPSPISAPVGPTSAAPMGTATGWCPCCGTSTRRPGMWTKGAASARDPLPCALDVLDMAFRDVLEKTVRAGFLHPSRRDGFLLPWFWLGIKFYSFNS